MQQAINGLLEKIALLGSQASISAIEKDLLLHYTRELYEQILRLETVPSARINAAETEMAAASPEADTTKAAEQAALESLILMLTEEEQEEASKEENEEEEESPAAEDFSDAQENPDFPGDEESDETEELQSTEYDSDFNEDAAAADDPEEATEEQGEAEESEKEEADEVIILTVNEQPFREPEDFELEPELRREKVSGKESLMDFRLWSRDVRSYIGINDKYNFISELFAGNAEAYEEILNEINRMESAEEALYFLEQSGVTTLYKWREDGFSEQIFYNVLNQFFAAR